MALTLEYMRQLVRSRLDDEDFEDEYLDQALNEAQWDILRNRNLTFLEKSDTVTLNSGASSASYPTDIVTPLGILVTPSDGSAPYDITENYLDYADFRLGNQPTIGQSTRPLTWSTFASEMRFPAYADQSYTLTIDYIKSVPKVDGATVTTFLIPEEYQELLKLGAYMRIAKREDDYDVKQQEQQDYTRMLNDLIKTYTRNRAPRRKHTMRVMGR